MRHKDKAGKKLRDTSTVGITKPGKQKVTVKGKVVSLEDDYVTFIDKKTGALRTARYEDVKRIRY